MQAHVAASAAELAARPFPAANVPPETAARAPPAAQPQSPPRVTSREQVAPAATWRLVEQWCRRMRRCFRAAQRGDASLARRLRPADLWLEHSEHSCAATAAWDWDMRPLEHGRPAVPLPTSGRDGVLPATSIAMGEVERAAAGFPDQAIVSEMLGGIADDSECRRGTLLCAPHAGALANLAEALARTRKSVQEGWCSGGHASLPCWPLRTCPFSVVDESERAGKPKFRLTTDLSWPHGGSMSDGAGGFVDSVNAAMDRASWPANRMVRAWEFAEAASILRGGAGARAPRRVRLWSLDCVAFYRAVGRQRRELWRNGVFLPDGVQLDERCCFGDASAATKCSRISNFLAWHVRQAIADVDARYPVREQQWLEWLAARRDAAAAAGAAPSDFAALSWFGMFVDDGMAASADDLLFATSGAPVYGADGEQLRRAQAHFEAARAVLVRFGWGSEESKEQPPRERLVALGVEISLITGRMRISDDKRRRYGSAAAEVAAQRDVDYAVLRRLLGRLQFAAQCYPRGRQQLHATWRLFRAGTRRHDGRLSVSRSVARELGWWAAELRREQHEGVPLARCGAMAPVGEGTSAVYADASSSGFAAWSIVDGTVLLMGGTWSPEERQRLPICDLELLASTWGLVGFAPWLCRDVLSFTDNTVAQSAMSSLSPRSHVAQLITARRTEWLFGAARLEEPRRITSAANVWADVGSRPELGGVAEVARQAAAAGYRVRRVGVPWRDTAHLLACADGRGDGEWL